MMICVGRKRVLLGLGLAAALAAAAGGAVLGGCGSLSNPLLDKSGDDAAAAPGVCPDKQPAVAMLPHVKADHRSAAYWKALQHAADVDVLTAADVAHHNAAFAAEARAKPEADPLTHYDLLAPEDPKRLERDLRDRLAYMHERIADGRYVHHMGDMRAAPALAPFEPQPAPASEDELRRSEADIPLRCGPRPAGLYKGPEVDLAFDRNSCSTVRTGELVRVIAKWPGGMWLVRTSYALGWIDDGAKLSAPMSGEQARAVATLPRGISRAAVIDKAFSYLDTPYGWGGKAGGRDCSRFVMDVFGSFGLLLPRHSGLQAKAGSMAVDVSKVQDETERLSIIDAAHGRGIVLLHFPGHIMLYLGRSAEGTPMAIHAFAEYLELCSAEDAKIAGRSETLRTVDRVQISDLSLGKGTSRTSFLERITQVVVLGNTPGHALIGAVKRRPAAPVSAEPVECEARDDVAMFISPRRPHPGAPLRVIVSASRDLGSARLVLRGPGGERHVPELKTSGGPPYGYWAELPSPSVGRWQAMMGEGQRVDGCVALEVHDKGDVAQINNGRVWQPRRRWTPAMERLYSTWVEQLFNYPLDDRTWNNLQSLLGDRDRNILHDHFAQNEDGKLVLRPDCADLPYFLRAYFSWKMRLPFAYRRCNRGFKGKVPYCDRDTHDNLVTVTGTTELQAFGEFARVNVANGVHSGSGRTGPSDDDTDYYPLPLTREAIVPGTIFADPYGHLFVVADWIPQGVGDYGVLVGADAQPDGTIGRRRFWPGSFLFTPETKEAGAGFKAFRPTRYRGGRIRQYDNAHIAGLGLTPHSLEQYQGTKADFYDKIEALINPRPLEPRAMLTVLATALYEQVKRRVVSVSNAEEYKRGRRGAIEMPRGHSIFETTGPWEDYSTPSRDMRLLIAMDTVLGFPDAVKRNPERFGADPAKVDETVVELRGYLDQQLQQMPFAYVNSGGSEQPLTVKDVVDRADDFQMAYNPNDCVEIRWAAPEGSAERASCQRHAPEHQLAKMKKYRPWFADRRRPPR